MIGSISPKMAAAGRRRKCPQAEHRQHATTVTATNATPGEREPLPGGRARKQGDEGEPVRCIGPTECRQHSDIAATWLPEGPGLTG
jgi:hypothetical protein